MPKAPSSVLLFKEAQNRNLNPQWHSDFGFFSFLYQGTPIFVYQTKSFSNSQMSSWITNDKFATHIFVEKNGFPAIPYCYSKSRTELNSFFERYRPLIAKPVLGQKAQGVQRIKTQGEMFALDLSATIFEQYIEGTEYRYLLVENEVIAAQEKTLQPTEDYPWKKKVKNLEVHEYKQEMAQLAQQVSKTIQQGILAVDFIQDHNGKVNILELNSIPGLWPFENPDEGEPKKIIPLILDTIINSQLKSLILL